MTEATFAERRAQVSREIGAAGSEAELSSVAGLLAEIQTLDGDIAEAEETLRALKEERRKIEFDRLPHAMRAAKVGAFTGEDQTSVALETLISATLGKGKTESEEDHEARVDKALAWLEANGHGGIIKLALTATLPRGDDKLAAAASAALAAAGVPHELEQDIHHSTLRAFVEERLGAGEKSPEFLTLFRVAQTEHAVVTAPKAPKKRRK